MTLTHRQLWRIYNQNTRAVEAVLDQSCALAKDDIRKGGDTKQGQNRVAALLLAAFMEAKLNEILVYPNAIPETSRKELLKESIVDRWTKLIELGFEQRMDSRYSKSSPRTLTFEDKARRAELLRIVADYVDPLVQSRNRIAHGQWKVALTTEGDQVSQSRTDTIYQYTVWRVILQKNLLIHFTTLVHNLVVTRNAHDRDFDLHFRNLESAEGRMMYPRAERNWVTMIEKRHARRPKLSSTNK